MNSERPDPSQQAVLDDESLRLLVEAPPGSGKTRTAVRLAQRDIQTPKRVGETQRVLLLTFSRNARAQLQGYADALLSPDERRRCLITNYHAFFAEKVLQFAGSLGLPADIEICTAAQRDRDLDDVLRTVGVTLPRKGQRMVRDDYSRALEFSLAVGRPDRLDTPHPQLNEVATQLRALHQRHGRLYFDDLAYYMWSLIDGSRTLRQLWRHRHPVVILDEYQDTSPLQAAIVRRLVGQGSRVYAFADPLQQIYTWRDASLERLREFRHAGCREHRLRTLHRYQDQPALQQWMEQARDVLLDDGASIAVPRPEEIVVKPYDHDLPQKNRVFGTDTRTLFQLDEYVRRAFASPLISSIGVLVRRRAQLAVIERHLSRSFHCSHLGSSDARLDDAAEWIEGFPSAITPEHHALRLIDLATAVAPRHPYLEQLRDRVGPSGIDAKRLRDPRRAFAASFNSFLPQCDSLQGALTAAQRTIALAVADQDTRLLDRDALRIFRRVLRAPASASSDSVAHVRARIQQARHAAASSERLSGLYLLTCHEGKGKEFDFVILPWAHTDNFGDDEEARQLLYVSLTRARRFVLVRTATNATPPICRRLGLA